MSYILDALKKSEEQRNALNLPATTKPYDHLQGVKSHRIQWAVVALLLAAGSGWFMAQSFQLETTPTTVIHNALTQPIAVFANKISNQSEAEPKKKAVKLEQAAKPVSTPPSELAEKLEPLVHVQETLIKPVETTSVRVASASPEVQHGNPDPATPEHASPPDLLTEAHEPAAADTHIPNRSDLPLEKQNTLPAIVIAGHIYDDRPSARMVVINGKVRREKQRFGDGLILEEITAQGIILSHRDTVFRMGIFD